MPRAMLAYDAMFVNMNRGEAVLWMAIGVVLLVAGLRGAKHRRAFLLLAPVFAVFGASDLVEATTGAWWRPWWLLVWKGVCVLIFLYALARYARARHRARLQASDAVTPERPPE